MYGILHSLPLYHFSLLYKVRAIWKQPVPVSYTHLDVYKRQICGYERYKDYQKALKLGIAAGSASAFSEGIAQKEKVESLMKLL